MEWAAVAVAYLDPCPAQQRSAQLRPAGLSVGAACVRVASTAVVAAAGVLLVLAWGQPSRAQVVSPDGQGACPEGFLAIGSACVNPSSAPGWTYPKPPDQDCLPDWMDVPADGECLRN